MILILSLSISLFVFLIIPLLGVIITNSAPFSMGEISLFSVHQGDNVTNIAEGLKNKKLIRSPRFFRLLAKVFNKEHLLRPGDYFWEGRYSSWEILNLMSSGKSFFTSVIIPEGYTTKQIAKALFNKRIIGDQEKFIEEVNEFSLEKYGLDHIGAAGFLFPDTYYLQKNMTYHDIIDTMVSHFFNKIKNIRIKVKDKDFYNKIILASIVEKEYQVEEEAAIIASVFYNRIQKRMKLESCATVLYIITEIQGKPHPKQLFYNDLEIDNPFNTYRQYGLPPAPISNPGLVAIKAAFYPKKSDYLFFVVKGDGSGRHIFSKDFFTHNYHKRHN